MIKRILAAILILSLLMGITSFAATTDPASVSDLSALGIIKGDKTGFNLTGQLKRSEAITIIARLIGSEDTILSDKTYYASLAKFSDVDKKAWYAPYIGYMTQTGIVTGYPNGTFQPDKSLSEKEMLKMLLSVVGYTYGTDYQWNTIYQKAYSWKVVQASSFETKTSDDTNYTREECFGLTRDVIDAPNKGTTTTLADLWRENGRFTFQQLKNVNLITDKLQTAITKVEATSATTVKVTLNESIAKVDKALISIKTSSGSALQVSDAVTKDNIITLTTSGQAALVDYSLTISSVVDSDLNEVKNITSSFVGFKPLEILSDRFLISKIEPVSKDTIKVYFTQDISAVPTIANFYDIYEGDTLWVDGDSSSMYIAKLTDSNKGVIIRLTNKTFNVFKNYTLKASGTMTDFTGLKMNNGNGDSMAFTPLVVDNLALKREITYGFTKDVVTIEFNKAVDPGSAQVTGNYQIVDSNGNNKIGIPHINPANPKQVLIGMIDLLTPGVTYKLHILNAVYDLEHSTSVTATNIEFTVNDAVSDKLKVTLIEPISSTELRVYFNSRIDAGTLNLASLRLSSSSDANFNNTPFNKYYYDAANNPYAVTLYLDPAGNKMKGSTTYSLLVDANLRDYLYQSIATPSYVFTGNSSDKIAPQLIDGNIIGGNMVKLEFNKEISSSNTSLANYKVKYKKADGTEVTYTPSSASVFNNKYVVLQFSEAFESSRTYRAEYTLINDYREDGFAGGSTKDIVLDYIY